jgi:hypothetical protein
VKFAAYFLSATRTVRHPEGTQANALFVLENPTKTETQSDGRTRYWRRVPSLQNRVLRVVVAPDGETILNAHFDRRAKL